MINFEKLTNTLKKGNIINPTEIFMALPQKHEKYSYLRNVQAEVLDQWFDSRNNKDNIIKMNTGSGKTTVALLILKSCLNENGGHAAYVVPDNFLVSQVVDEAQNLGIEVATSEKDISFIQGSAILVINIQKLFNGKSVFGMRASGDNYELDYILIDDVHACVDDVKSQFRLKISRKTELSGKLFELYKDDLRFQNEKAFLDICEKDPCSNCISVPFWRIAETKSELLKILQAHKNDEEIMYDFPLLGDVLQYCNCTFTYKGIEIEPYSIPIHKITAFCNAKRRIFMSATLCDDSDLISTFDIQDIDTAITPKNANDIGNRMILFPQAYNPSITDDDVKNKLADYAKKYNVVVIVPSNYRANYWNDVTENIFYSTNIKSGIQLIKRSSFGLYVFVNKYDGIDLPDNACRIIVLDGLPDARTALEKINENYLQGSTNLLRNKIQKIEQGMGRGVRSSNDYCGVIIMGAQLIRILYSSNSESFFSSATKKQFEISSIIAQDLKNKSIDDIFETLDYCITQNPDWLRISKEALSNLHYESKIKIEPFRMILRKAFNLAVLYGQPEIAKKMVCDVVNETDDPILKGFLMLEEAKYCHFVNPTDAQRILSSAQNYNYHILKPIDGINTFNYSKKIKDQAQQIFDLYENKDVNDYIVDLNAVIDNLIFAENSFKSFENSFAELGNLLGWDGTRFTDGIAPDVLWYMGDLDYAVIECKNEATSETISKSYCGQLLSSVSWFNNNFPRDCKCTPVMIHPSKTFDKFASPAKDFRIIDEESLVFLKAKIKEYCKTISNNGDFKDLKKLSQILNQYSLTPSLFFQHYSVEYNVENK